MSSQNAAIVGDGPGHATILDLPYPQLPGEDWIIVRATAVGLNPIDYKHLFFSGDSSVDGAVLGHDYAGVVEEIGAGVTKFQKGDRVAGVVNGSNVLAKWQGAMQKYIAGRESLAFKIPDSVSDAEAAAGGTALIAAAMALYQKLAIPPPSTPLENPKSVFIYGGSGVVGMKGIQLAKLSGCTVITTASASNVELLKSLGADHVLDYHSDTLVQDVLDANGGKKLARAWDAQAVEGSAEVCLAVLENSESSVFASFGGPRPSALNELSPKVRWEGVVAFTAYGEKFWLFGPNDPVMEDFEFAGKILEMGAGLLRDRKLKLTRVFVDRGGKGLEGMLQGLEQLGSGDVRGGKLVYTL
ncbi:zinc-binding dehydrogenase domain-containing protein [Sarocladium implicatum]|nr:zinc-binding dehydrogenase domain-containing protein [Sarocladium implicatum]